MQSKFNKDMQAAGKHKRQASKTLALTPTRQRLYDRRPQMETTFTK